MLTALFYMKTKVKLTDDLNTLKLIDLKLKSMLQNSYLINQQFTFLLKITTIHSKTPKLK